MGLPRVGAVTEGDLLAEKLRGNNASERALNIAAEATVQILKKMKIPGTKYLYLTEKKPKAKAKKVIRRKKRL